MKRKIKFRGKNKKNGEWFYGNLYDKDISGRTHICTTKKGCFDIDPDTVGQFTGLLDKNRKEIYEGDLLRFPAKDQYEQNNFVAYEIFWHDNDCADRHIGWQMNRQHFQGSLCGNDMGLITFLPHWSEKMEVIGNIHDNPELIEGGAE
jgi:uncharacterized phage protein (TIGR01671 family)